MSKTMGALKSVLKVIDKANEIVANVTSFGVPLIGVIVLYEVFMRYLFNRPTIWVHDISQFIFGAVYMLGAGYTLQLGKHVNMDMLYTRFSEKGKAVADVATGGFVLIFLGVLIYQSAIQAWESVIFNEVMTQSAFEPPLYPIKIIFFVGCVLFMLQFIAKFIRDICTIFDIPDKL